MTKLLAGFIALAVISVNLANSDGRDYLAEFQAINAALPPLIAYWPLNSYSILRDVSGNRINGIPGASGSSRLVLATGPWLFTRAAYETNKFDNTSYINFTSPLLNVSKSAYTIAAFVMAKGKTGPILEFADAATNSRGASLWSWPNSTTIETAAPDNRYTQTACNLSRWQFVASVYDNKTDTLKAYCEGSFSGGVTPGSYLKIYKTIVIGSRLYDGQATLNGQFSCISVHRGALNATQLDLVRELCSLVQHIRCSENCLPGTCDLTQPGGYSCSSCKAGWTGRDCTTPICTVPCKNAGTCIQPDYCSCLQGYLPPDCASYTSPGVAASGNCLLKCHSASEIPTKGLPLCQCG